MWRCAHHTAQVRPWQVPAPQTRVPEHALAILISWLIASGEYALQVPANRIGAHKAGLAPAILRGIAELTGIVAFLTFQTLVLNRPVLPNHMIGFGIVFAGVLIVLGGPWGSPVCKRGM